MTTYELGLFAEEINSDLSYPFAGHLDVKHMGVGGHSQGGCGAINAATRYERSTEIFKSLFTTSMPHIGICNDMFPEWKYNVGLISIPYYMNCGTGTFDAGVIPIESMYNNYNGLPEGTPAVMAVMTGSDHNIVNDNHGCGSMNAWFCYTLKDDPIAAGLFTDKCELANNTERWQDVNTKNLR